VSDVVTVLIVEDSATQAAALAVFLERDGFRTIVARRAERALELLASEHVDIVLSDVLMPGMDGYELCRRIKAVPEWASLPVVLLTSLSDPLAIVRGLESGADHYVTKPYDPEGLLARVRLVLERAKVPRTLHPRPFSVELLGTPFTITATKEQILELLVSSYSDLVRTSEAVRDAERRARFLAEAMELLSSSLDVHRVLRDLARLIVPRFADICAVDLLEPDGKPQRVDTVHGFSAITLSADAPQEPAMSGIAQRAIAESMVQMVPEANEEALRDVARDPALFEALCKTGPYALLVIPLIARQRVLGFLQFLSADVTRATSTETRLLAEDLARRASVAVDNALLYGEAQRATRARDDVLAIVSHDLRNPLNTIHMSTSFLLDVLSETGAAPSPVPLVPQLQLIRRATARGNALIQDLLDVSRIESGTLAVEPSLTSASALLNDAVLELEPLFAAKRIRFEHEWIGDDAEVPADRGRVAQVFSNLVGNAVKFTPAEGVVALTGQRVGSQVEFVVTNSGDGIASDHIPHLFDRFWKATKGSRTGAGLGLFIVKGIVESHGGSVTVTSTPEQGTRFSFRLTGATTPAWRPES
jgi:signal transduction histidine kinase/DNA-binding response OmpR family regulator